MTDKKIQTLFARVSSWTSPLAAYRIKNILGSRLKPGMTVLDIGTGPGTILLGLKRLFPECRFMGMDVSEGMMQTAGTYARKANLSVPFFVGDGQCIPVSSSKIDAVISLFAIHHMDQPDHLLAEIDRVLKPKGSLLIIDFRRDMSGWLFGLINTLWRTFFLMSVGRSGFSESVHSAWRPDEIKEFLGQKRLDRFRVHTNRMELWVIEK